jgi:ethanolamine permease
MSSPLKKTLTPLMLWGLGVGYVISGMYFGWNLGLKEGGTLGMAIATFFVIVMYVAFSFSYSELACAIPKAGGAFDYANRALGTNWGFIAGLVQVIEFVFAPPAIALGIGAYFHLLFPEVPVIAFAIGAYLVFTTLNIYGVKAAASFEFFVTLIALAGLFLFASVAFPHFDSENIQRNVYPNGWIGTFAALPFAVWFFLGIEGVANVAEETINPQKDITKGFGSAILTLVIVCIVTFVFSIGVGGWEVIVFDVSGETSDSPLPLAMKKITGEQSWIYKSLIAMGTFGLIASFHGLLLSAGRATFEMGRINYAPAFLGKIHPVFQTPYTALLFNMCIGIVILFTGKTAEIITISVFGALMLYIISMVSLLVFRKKEPYALRPFKVPFFPYTPILALGIAVVALISMICYNWSLALMFFILVLMAFVLFRIFVRVEDKL